MRKILTALAVASMLSVSSIANAADSIPIYIYNDKIQNNLAPIVEQGRVLVPIRVVSEALGAKVEWDKKENKVTVRKWAESVILTIGKNTASVDGKFAESGVISLDVSAKLENNRVFVPLRFLSELYGYRINWDGKAVTISSPLNDKERKILYEGSLQQARKLAMDKTYTSIVHYEQRPLEVTREDDDYSSTFLFPEGEALRFYVLKGDTALLYEFKEDFPMVTWQAHIQKGDNLQNFLDHKLFDTRGTEITINKKLLYYNYGISGDSSAKTSGSIDEDNKIAQLGFEHIIGGVVSNKEGKISLELSNETRKEVVNSVQ
ncbi:stalk domain-containing protein [Paenibacillus sp. FA6]|uniref:copper amine oxidase N-terminal domain-containing protein n=1 Tax=Paenibacillus sp. FA6 TaxID=3413029 RepID=UPI003F6599EB